MLSSSAVLYLSSPFPGFPSHWNEGLNVHLGRAWPSGFFTDAHLFVSEVLIDDLEESRHETLDVYTCRLKFIMLSPDLSHLICDLSIRLASRFV